MRDNSDCGRLQFAIISRRRKKFLGGSALLAGSAKEGEPGYGCGIDVVNHCQEQAEAYSPDFLLSLGTRALNSWFSALRACSQILDLSPKTNRRIRTKRQDVEVYLVYLRV
jgi:hypothetical protein